MARRGWNPARRDNNDQVASPALLRLMGLVIGIAMLMGLAAGIVWTLYHLVWRRWLG